MGQFNDGFIPAAILYKNPGMDLTELTDAIGNTMTMREGDIKAWVKRRNLGEMRLSPVNSIKYHQGIFGTLDSLGAITNPGNKDFRSYGRLSLEGLEIIPQYENSEWQDPKYVKSIFIENKIGIEEKVVEMPCLKKFSEGDIVIGDAERQKIYLRKNGQEAILDMSKSRPRSQEYIVKEVISTDIVDPKTRGYIGGDDMIVQKLKIAPVYPIFNVEEFENIGELIKQHPKYNPKNFFDKTQKRGDFSSAHVNAFREEGLPKWKMENGKYYLDINNMFGRNMEHTYSSIVLTSEAIEKKSWDVLHYHSGCTYPETHSRFLLENKDSHGKYLRALRDWWTSKNSQITGMTNSEMLRERSLIPHLNLDLEQEILRSRYSEQKDVADRRIAYKLENKKKSKSKEIPF